MADNILGRNKVFPIYNEDGTAFHNLVLRKSTVDSVVMSLGDKITGDVYYKDTTLAVTMGEYIVYNDVKYTLVNPPTVVKEGMVSDNGDLNGMTKYSFVFYHPMYHLLNFPFTDVAVQTGQEKYLSQNKSFSWIGTLVDYVAKINKNLQGTQWVCAISSNVPQEERTALSEVLAFDNATIADALKRGYETWEVPYIIDQIKEGETYYSQGKRFLIQFGLPSQEIIGSNNQPFVFKYGQGVGLKNHSRNPRNNKIITRIAGYGSEDNIPWGYPQIVWTGNQEWNYTINNDPTAQNSYPIYDGIVGGAKVRLIKHPFTRTHLMPSIYRDTVNKKVNPNASGYNPSIEIKDYYDADSTYANPMVQDSPSYEIHEFEKIKPELGVSQIEGAVPYSGTIASDGEILLSDFKLKVMERASSTSIDMERTALLGLYDNITLPSSYVDSGSQEAYSYQSSIGAPTDDKRKVEFKSSNVNFSEVVVVPNETPSSSTEWIDDIDENGNYIQGYFEITLPVLSFDLYASAALTQEMQINMRSGACIGCTFQVQVDWEDYRKNFYDAEGNFAPNGEQRNLTKYPKSDEQQITVIVQKDTNTFGTLMPNIYQQPAAGDEYVILGISLPLSYISDAEERLDADMKQYMRDNNVYYFDYPLKFDEYFLAKNINILSQLRTNTIVRFQYNGEQLALYVKQLTIKYDNTPLPQYDITLTDDVEIVLNPVGQVSDDVSKLRMLIGQGGVGSGSTTFDSNAPFVRKDIDDTTNNIIRILNGLQLGENFSTGLLGEGGVIRVDKDGKTYIEADKLYVRMKFFADTVEVRRFLHTGGNSIKSDAGINCTRVEYIDSNGDVTSDPTEAVKYRCYFKATDNDKKITNDFVVGDLAFCGETNVDNGSLSQHRYWRAVVGRNAEGVTNANNEMWIDLSATDCEAGSGIPIAQDDIIQLGNKTDTTRQGAIIEYVSGEDAPSYMIYQGINSYSLNGRNKLALGYNSSTGRAYLNVYGDFFFGNNAQSEGQYTGSYIKYNAATGALEIKGTISAKSPIAGTNTDLEQYIRDMASQGGWTQEQIEALIVDETSQQFSDIDTAIQTLQNQVDGAIETWYYSGTPTLSNAPANSWTTDADKNNHIGDLYYDKDNGYAYRFLLDETNNVYQWVRISDTDITTALANAAKAQDTADGKRRVFVRQPLDSEEYDIGDMWVNATYPATGTPTYSNEILRANTAKAKGVAFSIDHWEQASKYTDDTKFNNYINQVINGTGASGDSATVANAIRVIKGALNEATVIDGGLVLTSLINLRGGNATWAGISGQYQTNETGTGYKGHGIAAWYGGGMVDKEVSTSATNAAKSLFRFDGSGYLAGGNITWDKNGIVTIANVYSNVDGTQVAWSGQSLQYITNLSTLLPTKLQSGVTYLDPKVSFWSLSVQGKAVATQEWVGNNYLSIAFFKRLFQAYNGTTAVNPNDTTSTIDNIKAMFGFWTDQYLSALGKNASGGSSGGSTTLAGLTDTSISDPTNGQVLSWNGSKWVNSTASSGVDMSVINAALSNYLPLSGGTMSNTNLVTNLNADLLDGQHASYFATASSLSNYVPMHAQDRYDLNELGCYGGMYRLSSNPINAFPNAGYGNVLVVGASTDTCFQLGGSYSKDELYFRTGLWNSDGTGTLRTNSWRQVAFVDSNVASATKLQTPRTLWGQSFDGTANVSGTLTDTYSIRPSQSIEYSIGSDTLSYRNVYAIWFGSPTNNILQLGANNQYHITVTTNGNVGIGTTSPTYKLHVNGNTYTSRLYLADNVYLEYNSTNSGVRLVGAGFYSDTYVSALGASSSSGGSGGSTTLAGLTDTSISNPTNGQVLSWNGSKWVNTTVSASIDQATLNAALANYVTLSTAQTISAKKTFSAQQAFTIASGTSPFTVTSTTKVDNLNADLLDGQHASYFATASSLSNYVPMHTQDRYDLNELGGYGGIYRLNSSPINAFPNADYGNVLVVGANIDTCFQLGAPYITNELYFRTGSWYSNGTGTLRTNSWRQMAFVDSNVASATKLQTPRTLWGQSFDGTGNVSGTLTNTGSILPVESVAYSIGSDTLSYRNVYAIWFGSPTNNILQFGANNQYHITVTTNGNVGIGTTSPTYKLHVNGNTYTSRLYLADNVYLEYNSTNSGVRLVGAGFYSDTYVSALGASSSSGGGGGSTTLAGLTDTSISNLTNGQVLSWNGSKWVNTNVSASIDQATLNAALANYVTLNTAQTISAKKTFSAQQAFTVASGTSPFTVTSTTKVDNLNADLLDGQHASYFATASSLSNYVPMHTMDSYDLNELGCYGGMYRLSSNPINAFPNAGYGNVLVVGASTDTCFQLGGSYSKDELYFRTGLWNSDGTGTLRTNSWRQVAFVDSNVASATKLQTPRTLWGQSFDGTANVSGTLTDTYSIRPSQSIEYSIGSDTLSYRNVYAIWFGSPTNNILQLGANNQSHITITTNGNVGIGTTSPTTKLDVNGAVKATNFSANGTGVAPFYSSTTALCTNVNADLLDGLHKTGFPVLNVDGSSAIESGSNLNNITTIGTHHTLNSTYSNSIINTPIKSSNYKMWCMNAGQTAQVTQLVLCAYTNVWMTRSNNGSSWSGWETFAYTSSNVASATKLQTPRTLWGQSFDGTGNVSGTLTNTGSILPVESVAYSIGSNSLSYKYVYAIWFGSPTNNILQFGANNQSHITITTNGNVGIGTTSPSQKLHVAGTIYATGDVTALSDMRYKNVVKDIDVPIAEIAKLPVFDFTWKDKKDELLHSGSSAQEIQRLFPHNVLGKEELSVNYGATGTIIGILVARGLIKLGDETKDEITALKEEIVALEQRIKTLEEAA